MSVCRISVLLGIVAVCALSPCHAEAAGDLAAEGLTCEYAVNPLAIDVAQPRFGWLLKSDKRGQMQSAYHVLVAGSAEKLSANVGDKWDSGKIASGRSVNVVYAGKALAARERCWWKVRVFDKADRASAWSTPARSTSRGSLTIRFDTFRSRGIPASRRKAISTGGWSTRASICQAISNAPIRCSTRFTVTSSGL